jgi:DNA-binding MarR family transcriptional regulator
MARKPAQPDRPYTVPAIHRRMPQYLLRRLWQVAGTLQSDALAPYGLAFPWHSALLAQIRTTPGLERNALAAAIGVDATSTGQALAAFEARGLVRRDPHPEDGRAHAITLTPAGEALVGELAKASRKVAATLLAPLSEEEADTLLALLVRLVESHEPLARPGAGRRPPRRAKP